MLGPHMTGGTPDNRSASVFDPSIRGRTDRVVYRFRKPRG